MEVKDYPPPPPFNTLKSTFRYCIQFWAPPPPRGKTEKLEWVQQKAPKLVGSGALALWGDAEGLVPAQPGDEMTLRGPDSSLPMPKTGQEHRAGLPPWGLVRVQDAAGLSGTRGGSDQIQGSYLHCENIQALEKFLQGGCAAFILRDFQSLTR